MARAAARAAGTAWDGHRRHCAACTNAARARNWAGLCYPGLVLHDELLAARAILDSNRRADAQPITGQGMLL